MDNTKRPVVLVDLDNVVYDFIQQFARWLDKNDALHFELDLHNALMPVDVAMREYKSWSVWDDWDIPQGEFIRWWRLGIENGYIYKQGPLIAGARNALWKLSDAEWDIHIATSRLTKFGLHDQIILNTASWLRDNNIPYRNIHFTDNKRSIGASAIVDDRADNMDEETHGKVFEFPANHNQKRHVDAQEQREAWEDIVNALT